ncbi:sugar transferase [Vibrio breoganii]|uniref:glycosyltransferase n=1 Tax=Vibrio breoganii TaxID=553239 RepID=UPI000C85E57D|nr:glycosyltransferase [Vibrio breoganii]PMM04232.1 sugar transferase [Vibrio breoganii]
MTYSKDTDRANEFAPIIIFVYNRLSHTKQTIEALQKNQYAAQSDLFIYSDAPKNVDTEAQVQEVRNYISSVAGFRTIKIVERDINLGLAANIIDGVTEVVNQYGKIIVMEDDIVTSPAYLSFMNQALDLYEHDTKAWHISGWNYPIERDGLGDTFFWRVMNCWGWATWADRWQYFDKNPRRLIETWNKQKRFHFDLDGSGIFWQQVTANASKEIDTWAIFWYASIYENSGLCLNPSHSFVKNIGNDGSGIHCDDSRIHNKSNATLCNKQELIFPENVIECSLAVKNIKDYNRKSKPLFIIRLINKLSRVFFKTNIMKV